MAAAFSAAGGHQTGKSIGVVPKAGPFQGEAVYSGSYALFVGIGRYKNPKIPDIKAAPNDATTMRNLLVRNFGFDPDPSHTVLLTDAEATKERIELEIARLCDTGRIKATDRVLVYFSCHGQGVPLPDGSRVGYLVPFDAKVNLADIDNPSAYQTSCLEMEEIVKRLRACPARHRVVMVDSCFSGFAAGTKALQGSKYSPEALRNMLGKAGLVVMTAGDDEEEAEAEASGTGLSIFTRSLIDSLDEGSINGGTFTAEQLAAEAAAKTLDRSSGKQKPQFGQKDGSGQMLLFSSVAASPAPPPKVLPTEATLALRVKPADATVEIDGQVVAATSTVETEPGGTKSVIVKIHRAGFKSAGYQVELTAGQTTSFSVVLAAESAPPVTKPARVTTPHTSAGGTTAAKLGNARADLRKPTRKGAPNPPSPAAFAVGLNPSAWPKFHGDMRATGLGRGTGATGTLKWDIDLGLLDSLNEPGSSPVIGSDGTIYVGSDNKQVVALNPDGSTKWTFATGGSVRSSPTIAADGTIYVGDQDACLYAIDANGVKKWAFHTSGEVDCCPAIAPGGTIYFTSDGKLYAVNPNGTKKWACGTSFGGDSSPAIGPDGTIYLGSYDNNLYAISSDGTQKWSFPAKFPITSSPAIGPDGTVYVGAQDEMLYAINPNGTKKWAFDTKREVKSSPAIASDGTVYIGAGNSGWGGALYAISPDGTLKWSFDETGAVLSSPAIGGDGTVYVGADHGFYAFNPDGTRKWKCDTDAVEHSSPAIGADGTIYVQTFRGHLLAIK